MEKKLVKQEYYQLLWTSNVTIFDYHDDCSFNTENQTEELEKRNMKILPIILLLVSISCGSTFLSVGIGGTKGKERNRFHTDIRIGVPIPPGGSMFAINPLVSYHINQNKTHRETHGAFGGDIVFNPDFNSADWGVSWGARVLTDRKNDNSPGFRTSLMFRPLIFLAIEIAYQKLDQKEFQAGVVFDLGAFIGDQLNF